ncbi:sialate O-acetylesterase [Pedobacter arcticus]|uniref:sialate O-acetylesterase n=1 Tax=Pedobacter arcticus TaxID=752140 RepID=UPI00030FBD56|nr:sialate O-acetylesterase [Pedobacter arcticus]
MYCLLITMLFTLVAQAEVKLPKLVSSGMVLQRDQNIKIWGWAKPGEAIAVSFKHKIYKTKTQADGKWLLTIKPQQAGGPFKMLINNIELDDVWVGDVWLCSGQSNMEALMSRPNIKANYPDVIENSRNPMIRQFTVQRNMAFNPLEDVTTEKGWISANPETVLNFSAVAYFFAKDLYEKYKIPIGIIHSSVGGTPIQSWVDSESLTSFPDYRKVSDPLKDTAEVSRVLTDHHLKTIAWHKSAEEDDLGIRENWAKTPYAKDAQWKEMTGLDQFIKQFLGLKYGVMWFKTEVEIPASLAGKSANLILGTMSTLDETYINGQKVGGINSSYSDRDYVVNAGILKSGKNTITIRLMSNANGFSFHPKNIYQLKFKDDSIALNKPWQFRFGIQKTYLADGNGLSFRTPTAFYYSMIKPVANYNIKGFVWYQGESNVARAYEYQEIFTSLIKLWRKDWQQEKLPFLYVQLANYLPPNAKPEISNFALLREAQLKTLTVPNTAMVVIHDLGEKNNIHPANKRDVGKRLALAAQKLAYHENVVFSGPIYKSMKVVGDKVYVSFDHIGTGLKNLGNQLNQFSISADGKNFVPAQASIVSEQVVVWNPSIKNPQAVRYAWADDPEGANLYNQEGLPASGFKSN